MFSGAIVSLVVAALAAVVSYGGVPNAIAAATAQHIYLIAVGLFVVSAIGTILDLEPLHAIRALLTGTETGDRAAHATPDIRQTRAM